jgi:hypothetical protein
MQHRSEQEDVLTSYPTMCYQGWSVIEQWDDVVEVVVLMDDNYNFFLSEDNYCLDPVKEFMRNNKEWQEITGEQALALDSAKYFDTPWKPNTWEIFEIKKGDWDEFQNTRR